MTFGQRTIEQRVVVEGEQVEGDERGRRLGRQAADARLGGVDALQQGVEVEAAIIGSGHDDLAVDDASLRQRCQQRRQQLGEVAGERPLVAAGQFDVVTVAEDDAAEPIPLRLVVPPLAGRDLGGRLGQHRRQRRRDRQRHRIKDGRSGSDLSQVTSECFRPAV